MVLRKLIFMLAILSVGMPTFATDYYLRHDGEVAAADKANATSCSAASTAMKISEHNAVLDNYEPGDNIILCDDGGAFWHGGGDVDNSGLVVQSSGESGNPITYTVSGDVVFAHSYNKTGWSSYGSNIWYVTQTAEVSQLFFIPTGESFDSANKVHGTQKAGATLSAEYDWVWDETGTLYGAVANRLYVYTGGNTSEYDPDGRYAYVMTSATNREFIIDLNGQDYITIDGIDDANNSLLLTMSAHSGVHYDSATTGGQTGLVVKNLTTEWNQRNGVLISKHTGDVTIENIEARYNGRHGISVNSNSSGTATVRYNNVHSTGIYQDKTFDSQLDWNGGMKFWGSVTHTLCEGNIVEYNWVHDNGPSAHVSSAQDEGTGIWFDNCASDVSNKNIVRYNRIEDNSGTGLYIEKSDYTIVHHNLLDGNGLDPNGHNLYLRADTYDVDNNWIYNNTIVNGYNNIRIDGDDTSGASLDNNLVKNNITSFATNRELYLSDGADNVTYGTGNVYDYNTFGPDNDSPGIIQVDAATFYNDYDSFPAYITNSIKVDGSASPVEITGFRDPARSEYWLQGDSPGIGAGTDLGATYQLGLSNKSVWPNLVRRADMEDYSSTWDIGAYTDKEDTGNTYYFRADGTCTTAACARTFESEGDNAANAMDITEHNGNTFDGGDLFLFVDTGGTYRVNDDDNFKPKQGGTQSQPTVYKNYYGDTPIIAASDLIAPGTSWTDATGAGECDGETNANCWYATWAVNPIQIFFDDTRGIEEATAAGLDAEGEWYWDDADDRLYVHSTGGDPDTQFTDPGVEVTDDNSVNLPVNFNVNRDWTVIDGLTVKHGGQYNINVNNRDMDGFTLRNCTSTGAYYSGARINGADGTSFGHIIVEDNVFTGNGGHGFNLGENTSGAIARRNTSTLNGHYAGQTLPGFGDVQAAHNYLAACKFTGANVINLLVEHNICNTTNTTWPAATRTGGGNGIWTDVAHHANGPGTGTEIRYNYAYGNTNQGIRIEITSYARVHHNVVVDNIAGGIWLAANDTQLIGNWVYNNSVYGSARCMSISGGDTNCDLISGGCVQDNIFRNNAVDGCSTHTAYFRNGGENDGGTFGQNNRFIDNSLGATPVFWVDDGVGGNDQPSGYDAAATLLETSDREDDPPYFRCAAADDCTQNVDLDDTPSFTDPAGSDDLTLQAGSVCVNNGIDLGDLWKMALDPAATWVDGVATLDQDDYGAGWECGAYVYEE